MPNHSGSNIDNLALTGAEAVAEAMRQIEPGVVPVYPITPQTPIIENYAALASAGKVKTEIITAESEHSVMSAAIGSAASGSRTMTATSSVGLALMYEMLGIASGLRLPIVMNVANRALSSPLNIHCDHSDSMGVRDVGWIQIFSDSAQEAYDNTILAIKLGENRDVYLPVMVMQDGFETSHMLEKIETISDDQVKKFIGKYKYPNSLLGEKAITWGALMLPNAYLEAKYLQNKAMENVRLIYKKIIREFLKISNRNCEEVETYEVNKRTEAAIVVMGSSAGTAKEVARILNLEGHRVGVIKIRLFRPFPYEEVNRILKNVPRVAVLDRALSFGSCPPLYTEIRETLQRANSNNKIQSYIFGLGGRTLREKDVNQIYAEILGNDFTPETKFVNLKDESC